MISLATNTVVLESSSSHVLDPKRTCLQSKRESKAEAPYGAEKIPRRKKKGRTHARSSCGSSLSPPHFSSLPIQQEVVRLRDALLRASRLSRTPLIDHSRGGTLMRYVELPCFQILLWLTMMFRDLKKNLYSGEIIFIRGILALSTSRDIVFLRRLS